MIFSHTLSTLNTKLQEWDTSRTMISETGSVGTVVLIVKVNSSPTSVPYMCRWTGSAMVQIMACHMDGVKPLSDPNADIISTKPQGTYFHESLFEIQNFSFKKICLKMSSVKWRPFCPRGDELTQEMPTVHGRQQPGGRLNKKDGLTRYGDSHVKDKTSWRPSYL